MDRDGSDTNGSIHTIQRWKPNNPEGRKEYMGGLMKNSSDQEASLHFKMISIECYISNFVVVKFLTPNDKLLDRNKFTKECKSEDHHTSHLQYWKLEGSGTNLWTTEKNGGGRVIPTRDHRCL